MALSTDQRLFIIIDTPGSPHGASLTSTRTIEVIVLALLALPVHTTDQDRYNVNVPGLASDESQIVEALKVWDHNLALPVTLESVRSYINMLTESLHIVSIPNMQTISTGRELLYAFDYRPCDSPPLSSNAKPRPTILFLHGFPSTHHDWDTQISFFANKGYGVIAPDLLGYNGTDAPKDPSKYRMLDMAQDVIDILDHLRIDKVIGVSHDWGSPLLSRLLNLHIDRFVGAAFLAVSYTPPQPDYTFESDIAKMNQLVGYDVFGYTKFFSEDDAATLCEKNIDSFHSLLLPNDPYIWRTDLAPLGKAREWITGNKQLPRPSFLTAEQQQAHKQALFVKGLEGPMNWYKARIFGLNKEFDAKIPEEAYQINIPTLFLGSLRDQICLIELMGAVMAKFCSNMRTKALDVGHFIMLEAPDEVNKELEQFFSLV